MHNFVYILLFLPRLIFHYVSSLILNTLIKYNQDQNYDIDSQLFKHIVLLFRMIKVCEYDQIIF